MSFLNIVNECPISATARVLQLRGMFDLAESKTSRVEISANLPIEDKPWNIGLICGPSGSGKSSIAKKMFGEYLCNGFDWPTDRSIVDAFPSAMGIKDICQLMSSVGFSSPPNWLRPFHVLSNGEQFRVTMARMLAEAGDKIVVMDEYSSVVDRTVAQIGSSAIAKTIRARKQKFIAVTCHEDVEDYLQPDWIYRPATNNFTWRFLRPRPPIELQICRVKAADAWPTFRHAHYLSADLNPSATTFVAFWKDRPVALSAWLNFIGRLKYGKAKRATRTVCLPEYQGVGIGYSLLTYCASLWAGLGYRAFGSTSHPALIAKRAAGNPDWVMTRAPGRTAKGNHAVDKTRATNRLIGSFEYTGKPMPKDEAERLLQ